MLARPDTKVRGRFCVKRCGPSRRRVRTASSALKNFVRRPEKTFSTVSARNGHAEVSWRCPLLGEQRKHVLALSFSGFDPFLTFAYSAIMFFTFGPVLRHGVRLCLIWTSSSPTAAPQ